MKWRSVLSFIRDRKVPLKLKGKLYRKSIRPTVFYVSECWAVKGQQENNFNVLEMRMLC